MAKAVLVRGKEKRVEQGHPWIFRSDIDEVTGSFEPGDILDIFSSKGRFLARGYYNPKSQIAIRIMTREQEKIDEEFFIKRLRTAWDYRQKVSDPFSCRVVFAESDFLPALVADKFGGILVIQTLALGIDRFRDQAVGILKEIIKPEGIYIRNDVPVRELEGLAQHKGFYGGSFDTLVIMQENGIKFEVDVENGQKTGYFLDQKENRAAIEPFVRNAKVLDCFCHTGSFSLHAGYYGASEVLGLDISSHAVETAGKNARLNSLEGVCRFEEANVFDKLRDLEGSGEKFDVVILDPPAFAKSKGALEGAIRGYKEINLRSMKLLKSGGFLISCSCSYHISPDIFMDIIFDASLDARKKIRLAEFRTQAKDHPILLAAPETQYLKCVIIQVF